ncbi:MAG: ribokinase [Bacilli bacterium]|nr:ribokinase [Bacilli bacterium]
MSVLVVGSFVVDCIARCDRAPEAGETVIGNSFKTFLGGKGANQAFASIRMGSNTTMVGAVGDDAFGKDFIKTMKNEGFDTKFVKVVPNSTGTSLVTVEESGQNRICMTPGANMDYEVEDLLKIEIENFNIIVTQFEMQYSIAKKLSELAGKYNKKFILNPAPARAIDDELLKNVYLITPNETELGIIINKKLESMDDYIEGAKDLLNRGPKNVIVTLGTKGSLLVNKDGHTLIPAIKVKAIDTVGAGDSFTGSLASQLDQGKTLIEAMKVATAVAALEVQKNGAIPAMPYKEEVLKFMEE